MFLLFAVIMAPWSTKLTGSPVLGPITYDGNHRARLLLQQLLQLNQSVDAMIDGSSYI
jgi:hypothetical protein